MVDVLIFIFPAALVWAAVCDLTRYEIPDLVSIILVAGFVAIAPLTGLPIESLGAHAVAAVAVFAVGAVLFRYGVLGGGDVKVLAASVLWVGWPGLTGFLLLVGVIGGILAMLLLVLRRFFSPRAVAKAQAKVKTSAPGEVVPPVSFARQCFDRLMSPQQGVPYGVAIGVAGLAVFPGVARMLTAAAA